MDQKHPNNQAQKALLNTASRLTSQKGGRNMEQWNEFVGFLVNTLEGNFLFAQTILLAGLLYCFARMSTVGRNNPTGAAYVTAATMLLITSSGILMFAVI